MSEIQVNLPGQVLSFWIAAAVGAAVCLCYDVFRIARLFRRPSAAGVFVQDLVWWLIAALVTYGLMLVRCKGAIRFYALLGETFGFAVCRGTLSRLIIGIARPVAHTVRAWLRPVRARTRNGAKKIEKFCKNLLQRVRGLLYNFREHFVRIRRKERVAREGRKKP